MALVNIGQNLLTLAIIWGGLLLLTRICRAFASSKIPYLSFALNFLRKIVKLLAIFSTGVVLVCFLDVKEILATIRESISAELEMFLREIIDVLFDTRSFLAIFQIVVDGVVVVSAIFCTVVVFLGNLAYLCLVILRCSNRPAKVFAQQTHSAQAFTTNAYNFQRKYFIRA